MGSWGCLLHPTVMEDHICSPPRLCASELGSLRLSVPQQSAPPPYPPLGDSARLAQEGGCLFDLNHRHFGPTQCYAIASLSPDTVGRIAVTSHNRQPLS